jgi:hypothetical protein
MSADKLDTVSALRHFAELAPACWEGSDADDVISVMLKAADLLDINDGPE